MNKEGFSEGFWRGVTEGATLVAAFALGYGAGTLIIHGMAMILGAK